MDITFEKEKAFLDDKELRIVDEKSYKKKGLKLFDARNMKNQDKLREVMKFVDYVYGAEFHTNKDYGHQLNSGLDLVIAKVMKDKKVTYCFNATDILDAIKKKKYKIIARVKQNVQILKKRKTPYFFISGKTKFSDGERKFLERFFNNI